MNFLAISGSARQASTNTALLEVMADMAPSGMQVTVFDFLQQLPIFSPDLEGAAMPDKVREFIDLIGAVDGLII